MEDEEESIRQSFLTLGYTHKFIEECRTSAYKGRRQEIQKEHMIALQELPFAINWINLRQDSMRWVSDLHSTQIAHYDNN